MAFVGSEVLESAFAAHPLWRDCLARWTPLPGHTVVLPVAVPHGAGPPADPPPSLNKNADSLSNWLSVHSSPTVGGEGTNQMKPGNKLDLRAEWARNPVRSIVKVSRRCRGPGLAKTLRCHCSGDAI